jgi:hypothetical protein
MSAILSTNVTYALIKKTVGESGYRKFVMTVAFGNSALTYPTGGVPLLAGSLGCPNQIISLVLFGPASGDGYVYKWDAANKKILMYRSAGFTPAGSNSAPAFTGSALGNHAHDLLLKNAAVADGASARVNAGANLLGANTGGDLTVAGAGANGGVQNASAGTPAGTVAAPTFTGTAVAAGVLVELANTVAPAATTLYLECNGW